MGDWQPINTAPKDGTDILVYWQYLYPGEATPRGVIEIMRWSGSRWWSDEGGRTEAQLTHWHPLPSPPDITEPGT